MELILNYLIEEQSNHINGVISYFSRFLVNNADQESDRQSTTIKNKRMKAVLSLGAILMSMKPRGQLNKQNVSSTITFLISIFLDVCHSGSPEEQTKAKTILHTAR